MNKIRAGLKKLWQDEDGLGTLEILLIVAVLVALAIIFRKWIVHWFNQLIGNANTDLNGSSVKPCDPSSGACTQ
jgi:Flp pilus assembly pilin Flp